MRNIKRTFITTCLAIVLIFGMSLPVNAATCASWSIRYIPGAPSDTSAQTVTVNLDYYSGGYYANCTSISGTNGRALTISSSSAGGMNPVSITTTGRTGTWKMKSSTTGTVTFKITATSGYSCTASGTICINS